VAQFVDLRIGGDHGVRGLAVGAQQRSGRLVHRGLRQTGHRGEPGRESVDLLVVGVAHRSAPVGPAGRFRG
jgi:hypothetical protein